jgi:uncharacterized protein (UPF0335 family)
MAWTGTDLKDIASRIESLEGEKAGISKSIKEIYLEAKSAGFDPKAITAVLRLRKKDKAERDELQATIDSYLEALGMLADLPLRRAAIARASGGLEGAP